MDYTKFFAKVVSRRKPNLIREVAEAYMRDPKAIFLAGGMPNTATFPYEEINVKYKDGSEMKLQGHDLATSLQYGPSQGHLPLLEVWRNFQKKHHSPPNNFWDVAFTTGSQDACNKVFEMLIDEGQPVMVQSPAYTGTLGALRSTSPDFIKIDQDEDGIVPENISKVCEARLKLKQPLPKLLYVNPTGANPTGTVLTEKRKREIYDLARKYDFLILEDDAYYFLHFLEEQPISFFSLDTEGRVIRFDSFSKILSSGLRLGSMSAPKVIVDNLTLHIQQSNLHASSLSQMLLYKLLTSWSDEALNKHFKGVRMFYKKRRDATMELLKKHLTGLAEWTEPKGGMFAWVKVTAVDDVYDLVMEDCKVAGLLLLPGTAFDYDSSRSTEYVRLGYSYATVEEIDEGLSILKSCIKRRATKKTHPTKMN